MIVFILVVTASVVVAFTRPVALVIVASRDPSISQSQHTSVSYAVWLPVLESFLKLAISDANSRRRTDWRKLLQLHFREPPGAFANLEIASAEHLRETCCLYAGTYARGCLFASVCATCLHRTLLGNEFCLCDIKSHQICLNVRFLLMSVIALLSVVSYPRSYTPVSVNLQLC